MWSLYRPDYRPATSWLPPWQLKPPSSRGKAGRRLGFLTRRVRALVDRKASSSAPQVFGALDLIVTDGLREGVSPHALNGLLKVLPGDLPEDKSVITEGLVCRKHSRVPNLLFAAHYIAGANGGVVIASCSVPVSRGRAARNSEFRRQETGDRMGRIWDPRWSVDCTWISGVPSCPCGPFCPFRPFPYNRAPTTESLNSNPVAVGASLSP